MKIKTKKLINSFKYAFLGLIFALKHERNFRIMLYFALLVIFLSFYLPTKIWEKIFIFIAIVMVLSSELINTALERIGNEISEKFSYNIKIAKDVMASAVLISSIFAFILGLIIFVPYILKIF